jgi:hypothetical protein
MAGKKQEDEKKTLSAEQKEFCLGVANGLSPRAAYIKAFDCKESAASSAASRMLKRVNIQAEINRLRSKANEVHAARTEGREERALWSKAERMERLQAWAAGCVEKDDIPTALKCVDMLNKMDGAYELKVAEQQEAKRVQASAEQQQQWAEQVAAARKRIEEQMSSKELLA